MLRFQTFGAIDLRREGGERLDELLDQPKRLALLAVLAAHQPTGPVRREKLISLLWPDSAPSSARTALSTTLSRLRDTLGEEALRGRGEESIALSEDHVRSDVAAFQQACDGERYREAVEVYEGPFLEGFRPPDARPFEEWVARRRDEYEQRGYRVAIEAARDARDAREWGVAEACLRKARKIDPMREEAARSLMEVFTRRGDRASALRVYEEYRNRLDEEVGLSPSEELTSIADQIRSEPATDETGGMETSDEPIRERDDERSPDDTSEPRLGEPQQAGEMGGTLLSVLPTSRQAELLLIGVLVLAAGAGWLLYAAGGSDGVGSSEAAASRTEAASVAVLPFQVSGAASETWRDGMVTLLSTGLDGAAGLRAVADRTVLAAWEQNSSTEGGASSKEALSVARQVGARYAVLGSAVSIGEEVRFSTTVHEVRSGEPLDRLRVRGPLDSVTVMADELARRLVGVLAEESGRGWTAADVASSTTRSLPALKAYLAGERHYRHGDFAGAIEDFRRSVAEDTGFALGYWRLASSSSWSSRRGVRRYIQRAHERRERLPERERRILHAAWLLRNQERTLTAVDTARRLSDFYPDDPSVWYQLGDGIVHGGVPGGWPESETAFRNATRLAPGFAPYYIHHLQLAISLHHDSALATSRLEEIPDPGAARPWFPLAIELTFGEPSQRQAALRQLEALSDPLQVPLEHLRESLLHPADGDVQEAVLRRFADDSLASEALVHNLLRRGRITEALEALESAPSSPTVACALAQAISLGYPVPDSTLREHLRPSAAAAAPSFTRQLCVGIYLIERMRDQAVEELFSDLRNRSAEQTDASAGGRPVADDVLRFLRGYRAWRDGNVGRAVTLLSRSVYSGRPHFLASSWRGLWRGDLYRRLGDLQKAKSWYLTTWFHPLAHQRLGHLYEKMDRPKKAAAAYRRFIAGWEDADEPLQARVDEARKRLQLLNPSG